NSVRGNRFIGLRSALGGGSVSPGRGHVVDDDEDMRLYLRSCLRALALTVRQGHRGSGWVSPKPFNSLQLVAALDRLSPRREPPL
ncbi:MAG TPA: hypothetical protein VM076_05390, partial [Gemmatimonadaceae bacterium]|nr:hypothetical protein [Gemmatimonadaceae bacterium]